MARAILPTSLSCRKRCPMEILFFIGQANEDRVVLDFDGIGQDVLARGTSQDLAGADVELRAVPGTGQHVSLQFALVQGTADVGAVVGEGVDAALYFGQADEFAV